MKVECIHEYPNGAIYYMYVAFDPLLKIFISEALGVICVYNRPFKRAMNIDYLLHEQHAGKTNLRGLASRGR